MNSQGLLRREHFSLGLKLYMNSGLPSSRLFARLRPNSNLIGAERRSQHIDNGMTKITIQTIFEAPQAEPLADFLARTSGLSKGKIKDAMAKGAVALKKQNRGQLRRARRATSLLQRGDYLELHYDEAILTLVPAPAVCLSDQQHYSVWHKPSGLLAQGNAWGDHVSLLRQVELFFQPPREAFLVHRLDREVAGVMLIAHTRMAAARLSELFQQQRLQKYYRAEIRGDIRTRALHGTITIPLDGRACLSEYRCLAYQPETNSSWVEIRIGSGRRHQIRRHFEQIGFPILGDPRYGQANKNEEGLKLWAVSLEFVCPFQNKTVRFELPTAPSPDKQA
jgi:tRNA pseudouridine32 synthase/23S rRNA pseudouridine746 synthase